MSGLVDWAVNGPAEWVVYAPFLLIIGFGAELVRWEWKLWKTRQQTRNKGGW